MAIVVEKVLGGSTGKWSVQVKHGANSLVAELATDDARSLVGKSVVVELDIKSVTAHALSTEPMQILQLPEGHRVIGEVTGDFEVGDGTFIYDILVEPSADFLAVDTTDLGGAALVKGQRVSIDVRGLCFMPTRT